MTGSIGKLAEEIVKSVKQNALIKIAQHEFVKEASQSQTPKTETGKLLLKMANALRSQSEDVTISDVKSFLDEAGHAN